MNNSSSNFHDSTNLYLKQLVSCFSENVIKGIEKLSHDLLATWVEGRNVFICGNGGSAANAIHMANDLHYGIGACGPAPKISGLKVEALSANTGLITCLANDTGYENIYANQIEVKGSPKDLLIVLSGSGNSANVVKALEIANKLSLKTYAIVAFDGGKCLNLANVAIHVDVNDMQIAEDSQLIVGHLCMQWLNTNKPKALENSNV